MVKQFRTLEETIEFVEKLKHRWMATVDAMVDPMIIITKDYEIIQTNKALAEHSKTEIRQIIGKKCYEIFAQGNKPCKGCKIDCTFSERQPQFFELDNVCPGWTTLSARRTWGLRRRRPRSMSPWPWPIRLSIFSNHVWIHTSPT